jgi:hypothetical protein
MVMLEVVLLHPPLLKVKLTTPSATPVTIPALVTVATPGLLLLHIPPAAGLKVVELPAQMLVAPVTLTDTALQVKYVNGTTKLQAPPWGVILAYNVCEPLGKPEGTNVLGAVKAPADSPGRALIAVKIPLITPS